MLKNDDFPSNIDEFCIKNDEFRQVAGAGPWLVGVLSDSFAPDGSAGFGPGAEGEEEIVVGLRRALMATQLLNLWAAGHFVLAARSLREEAVASTVWAGGRANE